ncbi:MAG TPA: thiamine biosynthesis protein [Candidatus Corynebacterium avicola]|uniref:Thiamine biosynthesis protein n=1 Tax=Candidatus Corynebacterium avicola TaxID=2838527 RepID=A0A9D1UJX6_9CORY|nr:thiamine biosynthesis protein [Candidatus Corynebacterium avicola]
MRRASALAAAAVLTLGVAACGDDDDSDGDDADDTAVEQPADDSEDADAADDSEGAEGADGLSADKTDDLSDGDTITVTLSDLDTEQGYYLGICAAEGAAGGPPSCTGARDDSAWVAAEDEQRATDHYDAEGNAEVELNVASTSEDGSLDCTTDECVLKLFGDHQAGFGDVADLPVTFAS